MDQIASDKIVGDEEMLKSFLTHFPELVDDEVFFLSLSARNKYLTDAEREQFDLGRTEMFSRQVAYDHEGILMAIARMEADLAVRKTRNGSDIPHHCLVTYFNVHPSSTIDAYTAFKAQLDHHYNETFKSVVHGKTANYEPFLRSRTHLMNHIQKSKSRRIYIDIDVDCSDEKVAFDASLEVSKDVFECGIKHLRVQTQGGYHILIDREQLNTFNKSAGKSEKINLHMDIVSANKLVEPYGGEVVFNTNAMVPLPGTYQAGKLVTFDDFKGINR
jgi:hypothetical protein